MGLIRAAMGAAGGVMADQWKEFIYCESMPADVLACKGSKRTGGRSSNTRGEDNVISNGSVIAVNDGSRDDTWEWIRRTDFSVDSGKST